MAVVAVLHAALGDAGPASADGPAVGADIHLAQTMAGRDLTVIVRRTDRPPAPLRVDVVTHAGSPAGRLALRASTAGGWFAPWATRVYANATGLPLRDYTEGVSQHAARIPMLLVVFGVLVAVLRRQPAWLVGGIGGAVLGVAAPLQQAWLYGLDRPAAADVIVVATAAALLAALAGFLGARCAEILRHVMRQEASHA
ncbi:hypothetical protein [Plantactinospora sp. KLBMP9567]|uniref:hypothetical protein n=1 Tax=Plantactinospora sp. KLBMP9567 TaxID=3085900 RepID=UPI002982245E|nr:hypothetical protein [Plantactinospora sp. KLBMP9567]MDW5326481.1 hypothetical protein [Plantactinospora sp. KLBMP9567]